jgi:putative phosphoesterase
MRIAVLSDIHDNIWKLETLLSGLVDADVLICCGDLCSPFTLRQIADGFQGPVHLVFGNNDGDKWLLTTVAHKAGHVTLHDTFFEAEWGGRSVATVHFPDLGRALAASNKYSVVLYGHDHKQITERIGKTWLVNPGEVMGRFGRSTYAIYDTETDQVEVREV